MTIHFLTLTFPIINLRDVHSALNLPQASRLGMTKGKAALPWRAVAGLKEFFITLSGPQAHDNLGMFGIGPRTIGAD